MCLVDARLQEQKRRLHNIMTYQNFENAVQYGRTMLKQEPQRKEVFVQRQRAPDRSHPHSMVPCRTLRAATRKGGRVMTAQQWKNERMRELSMHISIEKLKIQLWEEELNQLEKLTGEALIFRQSYEMEAIQHSNEKFVEVIKAALILSKPNWVTKQ
jgi:hypothetical protein